MAGLVVIAAAPPRAAVAANPRQAACVSAAERAQELRRGNELRDAKDQLTLCMAQACPHTVRGDCTRWYDEVDRAIPTVVFAARGPDGSDLRDVRVLFDGEPLVSTLAGTSVAVDPGDHVLRFESGDLTPIEQRVTLREGEKDRTIAVRFEKPASAPAPAGEVESPSSRRPVPVVVYALGGGGLVAGGVFAYFLAQGFSTKSRLDGSNCAPGCSPGDVDTMRTDFVVADVAMYGAIGLLGAAAYFYVTRPTVGAEVGVSVMPRRDGAMLGVEGVF